MTLYAFIANGLFQRIGHMKLQRDIVLVVIWNYAIWVQPNNSQHNPQRAFIINERTSLCLRLKPGDDFSPQKQPALDFCPNVQNNNIYPKDVLLCCWLSLQVLAEAAEFLATIYSWIR